MKITPINYSQNQQLVRQNNVYQSTNYLSQPSFEGFKNPFKKSVKLDNDAKNKVLSITDNMIKKVRYNHISLLKHTNYSAQDLKDICMIADKAPFKLELMGKLAHTAYDDSKRTRLSAKAMKDFLQSGYASEFNKNYELYRTYIELNADDSYIAKALEQELDLKTFKASKYKQEYELKIIQDKYPNLKQHLQDPEAARLILGLSNSNLLNNNCELVDDIIKTKDIPLGKLNLYQDNVKRILYIYENRSNKTLKYKLENHLEDTDYLKKLEIEKQKRELDKRKPLKSFIQKLVLNMKKMKIEIKEEILP